MRRLSYTELVEPTQEAVEAEEQRETIALFGGGAVVVPTAIAVAIGAVAALLAS
jgi:hypothetical protein